MFVNAKQKNQALPQKNLRAKQNLPPKTGASVKTQSSKNVSCVFKNSKLPTSKITKKGSVIVQQDENDKNYKNLDTKCSLNPIEEKNINLSNSKDDSAIKEHEAEKVSKEIIMKDLENPTTAFMANDITSNQNQKSTNHHFKKEQMSLNLENFLTNVNIGKKNKQISKDEYRELLSKMIRDDYANSIIDSLLTDEEINENFLFNHKITERMRSRMVDWMIEVLSNYNCDQSTFFEAVNLMDRYFKMCSKKGRTLNPEELHIIGVTSMFTASKYQDIYPLRLRIIHEKIAHRKLSCEEIKSKEEEIAKLLNYSIGIPTMWDFINAFIEEIFFVEANKHHIENKTLLDNYYTPNPNDSNYDKNTQNVLNKLYTKNMLNLLNHVCVYLAKMNCHDYSLIQKKPSLLAAGTIYVAIKICEQINKEEYINDYFTNKLNYVSQKNENDIIKTAQKILYNAQNFDTLFNGLDNLKKVHFNAIIELKDTK